MNLLLSFLKSIVNKISFQKGSQGINFFTIKERKKFNSIRLIVSSMEFRKIFSAYYDMTLQSFIESLIIYTFKTPRKSNIL